MADVDRILHNIFFLFLKNKQNNYFKSSINVRIYYLNSMQIYYNAKLTSAALSLLDQV